MEVHVVPITQSPAVLRLARLALPLAAAAATFTPACVIKTSSTSLASDTSGAEDVNETESDLEVLGASFVANNGQQVATQSFGLPGDVKALDTTTTNPGFFFMPAGCVQVTSDSASQQSTYTFNDCTGPLGLVHLDGTVSVSWTVASSSLTLTYSAQNFVINGATITSWLGLATITANGNARDMTWNATLVGTTSSGRDFQRQNQEELQWTVGQACLAVNGQSNGTVTGAHLQTIITNYQRCAGACPQAGSEIQVDNLDSGGSIDIVYSGGKQAELTIDGKSETIGLLCGG